MKKWLYPIKRNSNKCNYTIILIFFGVVSTVGSIYIKANAYSCPFPENSDLSAAQLVENIRKQVFSGKKVDIDFSHKDLKEIFDFFSSVSGLEFELHPEVRQKSKHDPDLRYLVKNTPWDKILATILTENDLVLTAKGNTDTVIVKPENWKLTALQETDPSPKNESPAVLIGAILLVFLGGGLGIYFYAKSIKSKNKSKGYSIPLDKAEEISTRIKYLFEVDKIYSDENLSLNRLSEKLSVPSYQISMIVNERMKTSVSDLINSYRVEHIKRKLHDPAYADKTILELAFDAGFRTKTSFNRAFKKITHMTPSEYRNKNTP